MFVQLPLYSAPVGNQRGLWRDCGVATQLVLQATSLGGRLSFQGRHQAVFSLPRTARLASNYNVATASIRDVIDVATVVHCR